MMRSMFSGVSGLRIHQTKMDVIANNISNVNTIGFKSSRVTFAEIFAQTTSGASKPNEETGRGGTNPMQIGLGATVASIDLSTTQGAAQRTDNPYDLMIQGSGFFIVGDNSGTYFTRAGAFNLDVEGNFVNPSGMRINGWQRVRNRTTGLWEIQRDQVSPLQVTQEMRYAPPKSTSRIEFTDNLNFMDVDTTGHPATMAFYDSLGNRFTTTVRFTKAATQPTTGTTAWNWEFYNPDNPNATPPATPVAYLDGDKTKPYLLTATIPAPPGNTLYFTESGYPSNNATPANPPVPPDPVSVTFLLGAAQPPLNAATDGLPASNLTTGTGDTVRIDFSGVTQFGNQETNITSYNVDGHSAGALINVSIASDGIITGLYDNGEMEILGQIVVARFKNPAGLEKFGDNLYIPTSNSGDFDGIGEQVQIGGGKMMGGVLEMSNVDLAQEFTEMITTQRGFQANSRIITVSDDMLQELVNLKR